MASKEIEIVCPCCDSRLTVDVLTRTVLRAVGAQETDEFGKARLDEDRWDAATGKVKDRSTAGERLDDALERERERTGRLDDLFEKAKRKHEKGED